MVVAQFGNHHENGSQTHENESNPHGDHHAVVAMVSKKQIGDMDFVSWDIEVKHLTKTNAQSALAVGIFHRKEVSIDLVKQHLSDKKISARK